MAIMQVQVLSTETVRPSSPTPNHRRTHKLSLCDQLQLVRPNYIPIVLFYSSSIQNPQNRSHQLKQSLSETLTFFYPFAGRLKDGLTVDCNDEGAIYMEAQVDSDMSFVLEEPEISRLLQLLPLDPHENLPTEPTDLIMTAIQVNYFAYGGMAIGVCINHVIADASAAASFLNCWASVASAANRIDHNSIVYDATTLFTPQDFSNCLNFVNKIIEIPFPKDKVVTKRFIFEGRKIASLRNEVGNASRFEAITALIWATMIAVVGKEDETLPSVATMPLNLRNRTNPPFPQQCIGNFVHTEMLKSPLKMSMINLSSLSAKIKESITKVDDDYIRKLHEDGAYLDIMEREFANFGKNWEFHFNSWCRFPFYEIEFGWGKPIWVGTILRLSRCAIFLDTIDGKGVEAWVALTAEEMGRFERHPGILTYATFKPSI